MPYTAVTRAQLRALLQDKYESTPFWTDTDANNALNHAMRVYNLYTSYWRRRITVATVPNDPLVPIPGTLAQQTALTWQGRPMTGVSVAELLMLESNTWQARTTDGGLVPNRPLFWAPVGLNLVQIYPAYTGVGSIEVDGVRSTPVLTLDASTVDIGPEELNTLLGYALHVCALKAGASFLERTKPYLVQFIQACADKNRQLKLSPWYAHFQKKGYGWTLLPVQDRAGQPTDGSGVNPGVTSGGN